MRDKYGTSCSEMPEETKEVNLVAVLMQQNVTF
jgi:hypothetical protein